MEVRQKPVCIDFDGVLAQYSGYKGEDVLGDPIPGARDFVLLLQRKGFTPIIFTTRSDEYLKDWLKKHNFPELEITNIKYPAWVYIDDRALKFDGDYNTLISDMQNFEVYREQRNQRRFAELLMN